MNLKQLDYNKTNETTNSIQFKVTNKSRIITFDLKYSAGKVVVDITDSFFILRIPRECFNDIEKYKKFIIQTMSKIYNEFGLEEV